MKRTTPARNVMITFASQEQKVERRCDYAVRGQPFTLR